MYQPELWHEAFVVLGTGSAAIAGLIIVAASVRAEQIMTSQQWRLRARNSTLGMMTIMIGSILVLLPQSSIVLGVELIVVILVDACLLLGPVIFKEFRNRTGSTIRIPLLVACLYLLAAGGGASLIVRWGGGLYLTLAAYFGLLLVAIVNAYELLMPHPKSSKR